MRFGLGLPAAPGRRACVIKRSTARHPAGGKLADVVAFGTQAAAGPAAVRGACAAPVLGGTATRSLQAVAWHV